MIRKPEAAWGRENAAVAGIRSGAAGAATAARSGVRYGRAMICFGFAALWGFAALMAGLSGSIPTFIGVGAMSAFMAWSGKRLLRG